jgi:hypothetical protein
VRKPEDIKAAVLSKLRDDFGTVRPKQHQSCEQIRGRARFVDSANESNDPYGKAKDRLERGTIFSLYKGG